MKKLGCAKCGGAMKKMAKGGSMKTTVGSKSANPFIAGIPNGGPTGPNYQGVDTMKKGGAVKKVKKMAKGGSLKPVPSDKVGLAKLPTAVRNKMGYQKKGGAIKRK